MVLTFESLKDAISFFICSWLAITLNATKNKQTNDIKKRKKPNLRKNSTKPFQIQIMTYVVKIIPI